MRKPTWGGHAKPAVFYGGASEENNQKKRPVFIDVSSIFGEKNDQKGDSQENCQKL